ncbi:hypothetical protein V1477_002241 [Vespula maculifrons]|uniref:Uncharacterized protein n=1 Tax=Vespula maculifrons TaxID=7453 RepID=A0ABD2CW08_VESMC
MSSVLWLVIFIYEENSTDYYHNPLGNIFHLKFNAEIMVRCSTENILRKWYSIDTNQIEINDIATWSLERGITEMDSIMLQLKRYIWWNIKKTFSCNKNFSFNIKNMENGIPKKRFALMGLQSYILDMLIFFSDFIIKKKKLNVVDFKLPLLNSKNILVILEPEYFVVRSPFNFSSFCLDFGVLIVSSIFLVFLKIKSGTNRKRKYLLIDNCLEISDIFCQKGLLGLIQCYLICISFHSHNRYI